MTKKDEPGITMFQPNRDLEDALRRDVRTAKANLQHYLDRKNQYINNLEDRNAPEVRREDRAE